MWVEFVVVSRPCSETFSSVHKNQYFQIPDWNQKHRIKNHYMDVPMQIPIYLQ